MHSRFPYLACVSLLSGCQELHHQNERPVPDSATGVPDTPSPDPDRPADTAASASAAGERVDGECAISLRGPGLIATAGDSGEYCVATFSDALCTYRVEYGDFPDPFEHAEGPNFAFADVSIEGNPGRMVTVLYRLDSDAYTAGLYVATFAPDPPEYALAATARCQSQEALDAARLVLQTVQVPTVGSGLCEPIRPQKCSIL